MMQTHHDAVMRTTIDIPDYEHMKFRALARERGVSLSKLIVDLANEGLKQPMMVADSPSNLRVDPLTGLLVYHGGPPITTEEVKAMLDDEHDYSEYFPGEQE